MAKFGSRSKANLMGVHPLLVRVCMETVEIFDIAVTNGIRTESEQQELYSIGRTTQLHRTPVTNIDGVTRKSKHQVKEDGYGYAVDCDPYPINYDNDILVRGRYYTMYGVILAVSAKVLKGTGYKIRWGGDWNGNHKFTDQKFHDLPHIELVKE